MQIELTSEQRDFVDHAIAEKRIKRPEDAVQQGLLLWIEQERERLELLAALDEGEASFANEDAIVISEDSIGALVDDVKRCGRARMAEMRKKSR